MVLNFLCNMHKNVMKKCLSCGFLVPRTDDYLNYSHLQFCNVYNNQTIFQKLNHGKSTLYKLNILDLSPKTYLSRL